MRPNRNGVVTARNLGPEFTVGEETHAKINLRLGPGLFRSWDGRVCVQPGWVASRFDRLLAAAVVAVVFAAGVGVGLWVRSLSQAVVAALCACGGILVGWVAHRAQPDLE